MSCETERAAIKNAKTRHDKGKALQALLKCKHKEEIMRELQLTDK